MAEENGNIDSSPIADSQLERRNSLEKHLLTRPDAQDLKDRHILLDTNVAPYCPLFRNRWLDRINVTRSLQATRESLSRNRASDNLKKNLEKRPDREALVERIFPSFSFV